MNREDKELLLKDLCSKLPYSIKVRHYQGSNCILNFINLKTYAAYVEVYDCIAFKDFIQDGQRSIFEYKPYLRPMSSMTEDERKEFESLGWRIDEMDGNTPWNHNSYNVFDGVDWLNAHHFDYRGLIEKGLALEAPEGMY